MLDWSYSRHPTPYSLEILQYDQPSISPTVKQFGNQVRKPTHPKWQPSHPSKPATPSTPSYPSEKRAGLPAKPESWSSSALSSSSLQVCSRSAFLARSLSGELRGHKLTSPQTY
ncbi:hypothetical protein NA56DRAFT_437643 [Hyaloscypha hepaticicola]|uniref:Uncharacterized protein n=1 Tax=Hyaloscypha hepaticicola TaxID=2082293 RepID=A0A2J6QGZ3_9HELO|nr:hypothetical protein NA56DRAFT_437643 [Hyaloscypha hepaticicola]